MSDGLGKTARRDATGWIGLWPGLAQEAAYRDGKRLDRLKKVRNILDGLVPNPQKESEKGPA